MTHRETHTDPYNRVHIGPDRQTLIEHTNIDMADDNPIAILLRDFGVEAVTVRYTSRETLTYSKRGQS